MTRSSNPQCRIFSRWLTNQALTDVALLKIGDVPHMNRNHSQQQFSNYLWTKFHMRKIAYFAFATSILLAGCASQPKEASVSISPNVYRFNEIKSSLATPIVDALVELHPSKILIIKCPGTPNAKIIQFERELRARHMSELQMLESEKGCDR